MCVGGRSNGRIGGWRNGGVYIHTHMYIFIYDIISYKIIYIIDGTKYSGTHCRLCPGYLQKKIDFFLKKNRKKMTCAMACTLPHSAPAGFRFKGLVLRIEGLG